MIVRIKAIVLSCLMVVVAFFGVGQGFYAVGEKEAILAAWQTCVDASESRHSQYLNRIIDRFGAEYYREHYNEFNGWMIGLTRLRYCYFDGSIPPFKRYTRKEYITHCICESARENGKVALIEAVYNQNFYTFYELLNIGEVDPNEMDTYDNTALFVAMCLGNAEMVLWLLYLGADPDIKVRGCDSVWESFRPEDEESFYQLKEYRYVIKEALDNARNYIIMNGTAGAAGK